jgi:iron-sulfur cluster assembly protein
MLVLTPIAVEVVSAITSTSSRPDAAGVRIAAAEVSPEGANLSAELVECPFDGDQVLAQRGARVYLDETAAEFLDDKMLTAEMDAEGNPRFRLVEPEVDDQLRSG